MSRPSHVRTAIATLIAADERHDWAVDDVLLALRQRSISADFSSVCRGLARLEREGSVRGVNLGDGKLRYEAVSEHHDHIRCDYCGTVAEVPGCVVAAAFQPIEALTGFTVTGHTLLFSGTCETCVAQRVCQ